MTNYTQGKVNPLPPSWQYQAAKCTKWTLLFFPSFCALCSSLILSWAVFTCLKCAKLCLTSQKQLSMRFINHSEHCTEGKFWGVRGFSLGRQLIDSWETAERQLRGSWETAERQLRDSWKTAERHLRDSSKTVERLLRDCQETAKIQHVERVQNSQKEHTDRQSNFLSSWLELKKLTPPPKKKIETFFIFEGFPKINP